MTRQLELFKKPFICSPMNYIGGKYKLLPQIFPYFPENINTFVDLFCGGCNVGVNVDAKHVVFNDNLTYMIDLYRVLSQTHIDDILGHILERIDRFGLSLENVEGYNNLRAHYNAERNPLDLFVLVAYSFNHQIRFNSRHEFNCPFGKSRSSYNGRIESNLKSFVNRLQSIEHSFSSLNFDQIDLSKLSSEDFVYCDPPYLITTGSYNDGKRGFTGWGVSEERILLNILSDLNVRGVKFALSNVVEHKGRTNELLKEWIEGNGFIMHVLSMNYNNSNYHTTNKEMKTTEVLVTNF